MVLGAGLLGSCESKNTTTTIGGEATGSGATGIDFSMSADSMGTMSGAESPSSSGAMDGSTSGTTSGSIIGTTTSGTTTGTTT